MLVLEVTEVEGVEALDGQLPLVVAVVPDSVQFFALLSSADGRNLLLLDLALLAATAERLLVMFWILPL